MWNKKNLPKEKEMKRMVGEAVEKKLFDAASEKHQLKLKDLMEENDDQLQLVHGVPFAGSRNLVHVATMWWQAGIVEEVLKINPQLARMLDSQKLSPLHIAAQLGNVAVAKLLLRIAPETCWWREEQGMNPVHIAAMNGRVEVLKELIEFDMLPATERVHRGQTVLHLCVKHRQRETLEVLVDNLGELVCAKDDDGETLLHLAVRSNQLEIMKYLVESKKIEKLTPNSMGKTALEILSDSGIKDDTTTYSLCSKLLINLSNQSVLDALPKYNDVTMVAAVLIATMAFQAAVSPPGGVWQENTADHRAGEAVMAESHPRIHTHFIRVNATAFIFSSATIFILAAGRVSRNFLFSACSLLAMWVSLACIAMSYAAAIIVTRPGTGGKSLEPSIIMIVFIFSGILALMRAGVFIEGCRSSWKRKKRLGQDLKTASSITRIFYRIFEWIDSVDLRMLNLKDLYIRPYRAARRFRHRGASDSLSQNNSL